MSVSGPAARLVLEGSGQEIALSRDSLVVGREPGSDGLRIGLAAISREHARFARAGPRWTITDLGSRNGTFVNGEAVGPGGRALSDGDLVVLGGVASLRFFEPGQTTQGPRIGRLRGTWLDLERGEAWVDASLVVPPLSKAQFALLAALYEEAGRTMSRDEIAAAVWPADDPEGVSDEAIDGVVKRLRRRLREASAGADYIEVVRGRGIRLVQP